MAMATVYLTSDLHDGHKAIGKYRSTIIPEVTCVETNREFIRANWRATKRDTVIIVGDACFAPDSHEFYSTLPGRKILVAGNHDFESGTRSSIVEALTAFEKIHAVLSRRMPISPEGSQKCWIQHTPMHPLELRDKPCIHGHIHDAKLDFMNKGTDTYDSRYINVNIDVLYPRIGKIMVSATELADYATANFDKIKDKS